MPLIEAFTFMVVGAATGALVVVIAVVVAGIRHEERIMTMTRRKAPGPLALLTRRILGLYVRNTDTEPREDADRGIRPYERSR